jgi:hypothetical protein
MVGVKELFEDVTLFAEHGSRLRLRSYQREAARAIVEAVMERQGRTFVVMFPRQSGKNELQAQIEAYLLRLLSHTEAEMVKVSPTWKPQSLNAMRRLERVLEGNALTRGRWVKEQGYIYRLGRARMTFLSGSPTTNVVGATASTLLECDEAQDVLRSKWDKDIAPMAASTNATRVFWGTAWTSQTLLGRELRLARLAEAADGKRRAFTITADEVRKEAEAYGTYVDGEVRRLGRNHPLVRTQFFCEEVDGQAGMFPEGRRRSMMGEQEATSGQRPAAREEGTAFLIDVGGEEYDPRQLDFGGVGWELADLGGTRDATALTVVSITQEEENARIGLGPTYRVIYRRQWTGTGHVQIFGEIDELARLMQPERIVIDATGVGAGLASMLRRRLGNIVTPFIFTAKSKSDLGWAFLAIVETGRFKDYAQREGDVLQRLFWRQVELCQMEIAPGPGRLMRWGVPEGTRDPDTGGLAHDDLLVSAALCAVLEDQPTSAAHSEVIDADFEWFGS